MNILTNLQNIQLPEEVFTTLLSAGHDKFVFVKNALSVYQYANPLFLEMMGLKNIQALRGGKTGDFCREKARAKIYRHHDEQVIDLAVPLNICAEITPKYNTPFKESIQGKLYPIFTHESSQPIAVIGIVGYQRSTLKLTLDIAFSMSIDELDHSLTKRSWVIEVFNRETTLSKREIQCIIELLKGYHAGEIALSLNIKQTTVESYIDNIKNKLGATNRASLINTVLNQKVIQQIIL